MCALAGLWAGVGGAAILSHTFGRRAHCEGVERNIGKVKHKKLREETYQDPLILFPSLLLLLSWR